MSAKALLILKIKINDTCTLLQHSEIEYKFNKNILTLPWTHMDNQQWHLPETKWSSLFYFKQVQFVSQLKPHNVFKLRSKY